jgi:glyoxylase-like metal-dependent hydrolase (beta-lactamase superfamily II)
VFLPDDHVLIAGDAIMTMTGDSMLGVFNVDPEQAKPAFGGSLHSTQSSSVLAMARR